MAFSNHASNHANNLRDNSSHQNNKANKEVMSRRWILMMIFRFDEERAEWPFRVAARRQDDHAR
jgi:hypothetical protein